jgi:flavin reductase (DIM6/NTAB) family NADH-FMN oxidoreductase RutF
MTAAERIHAKFTKNGAFLAVKAGEQLNAMTISWWNIGFIWERPIITVAVRPTRYTFGIIEKADDFTVSVPVPDLPQALALCGSRSGRELDKLKAAGLTTIPAQKAASPIINIPGIHFEARILLRSKIDPGKMNSELEKYYPQKDYHTIHFGEIMACYEIGN